MTNVKQGKVYFAGAGPGDPELITVKAVRCLKQAGVILADRLVGPVLIHDYANPDAEVIFVGKQAGKEGSTSQERINELLVRYASAGKIVVRLKGGDVSVFSNILDELLALTEHHIPYEIIPGITAGLGAAAYAGIPLTARGHSTAIRFLTYYREDILTEKDWRDLATTNDTLVFYMSGKNLQQVLLQLKNAGLPESKPVALIEQATTDFQKVRVFNLKTDSGSSFPEPLSPALVIIGDVVKLHEKFSWFKPIDASIEYFESVDNPHLQQKNQSHVAGS